MQAQYVKPPLATCFLDQSRYHVVLGIGRPWFQALIQAQHVEPPLPIERFHPPDSASRPWSIVTVKSVSQVIDRGSCREICVIPLMLQGNTGTD